MLTEDWTRYYTELGGKITVLMITLFAKVTLIDLEVQYLKKYWSTRLKTYAIEFVSPRSTSAPRHKEMQDGIKKAKY